MRTNSFITGSLRGMAITAMILPIAFLAPSAASAEIPPEPVGAFFAEECAGTTAYSPTVNDWNGPPNLLQVFDGDPDDPRISRLEAYNQGAVVPLYDAFGLNNFEDGNYGEAAIPPICATRYVAAAGGPVSEWMFCTDYTAHSCAGVDEDGFGRFVDSDEQPHDLATATTPVTPPGNPRLEAWQQKLIAYLIQHGHTYSGAGSYYGGSYFLPAGEFATANDTSTSRSRMSLQILIWCVSDYGYYIDNPDPNVGPDPNFDATCDNSGLSLVDQLALADAIPDDPVLTLQINAPGATVPAGSAVRVRVTSNVFAQPLTVTSELPLTVCSGSATLADGQLSISGTDASVPKVIELCAIAPESGETTVEISVLPSTTEHIGWNQASTGIEEQSPFEVCQVYATFYTDQAVTLTGLTTLAIGEDAELAATGAVAPWGLVLAALGLLGAGLVLSRRRPAAQ